MTWGYKVVTAPTSCLVKELRVENLASITGDAWESIGAETSLRPSDPPCRNMPWLTWSLWQSL